MNWWVFRRRVHTSWLIAIASFGIVVGVILAQYFSLHSVAWLLAGFALLVFGLWRHKVYALIFIFAAGGVIGLWRGGIDQRNLAPYKRLIGYSATVTGVASEDPDTGKNGGLVLRLGSLKIDGHEMAGMMWVSASENKAIKRADIVTVKGKLSEGFGNFSASMYRAEIVKAQRPVPGDVAGQVRDEFAGDVRQAIPEPEASLGIGYLTGQRRALPPELDDALKIAGLSPSMSRAGLVAGLSLLAWYYGRKFHPLVLLPFAAAVTLLVNPSFGWNDLGWQLSFAAFGGVMIVAPLLQRYFFGEKKPGTIRQILGETVSAQIATLPILVVAFGQFSNVAIIANLLVLPLVPLAMLLTFVAGLGVLAFPPSAAFIGLPASWLLQYMTASAQYLAGLPWAQSELEVGGVFMAIYYAVLVAACVYVWRKTKFNLRDSNIVE